MVTHIILRVTASPAVTIFGRGVCLRLTFCQTKAFRVLNVDMKCGCVDDKTHPSEVWAADVSVCLERECQSGKRDDSS
jgi:hypothetical protein